MGRALLLQKALPQLANFRECRKGRFAANPDSSMSQKPNLGSLCDPQELPPTYWEDNHF